jgi:hypothetical protein
MKTQKLMRRMTKKMDIKNLKWKVIVTVNVDLKCMWIATAKTENKIDINMAGCGYFDKETPRNGVNIAKEGWKKFAIENGIKDFEVNIVKPEEKKNVKK